MLEVGSGSGYAAALLAHIAREVYAIERHEDLADQGKRFGGVWVAEDP